MSGLAVSLSEYLLRCNLQVHWVGSHFPVSLAIQGTPCGTLPGGQPIVDHFICHRTALLYHAARQTLGDLPTLPPIYRTIPPNRQQQLNKYCRQQASKLADIPSKDPPLSSLCPTNLSCGTLATLVPCCCQNSRSPCMRCSCSLCSAPLRLHAACRLRSYGM